MPPQYFIKRKTLIRRRERLQEQSEILREEINILKNNVLNEVEYMQRMLTAIEEDVVNMNDLIAKKDKNHREFLHGRI